MDNEEEEKGGRIAAGKAAIQRGRIPGLAPFSKL